MKYEVICPVCKYEFLAEPSILQADFGMSEGGHGKCPGCGTFLNLTLDYDSNTMTARVFDEWAKERQNAGGAEL